MAPAPQDTAPVEEGAPTTRCRIVAEAERSFRAIGYQKTTVADIARALRMSPANVYRFFDSKKAINEAVVARLTREVEVLITAIARTPGRSAAERLGGMIHALHADCRERCEAFPKVHEMVEAAMQESWAVCRAHVDAIVAVFERVIAEGVQAGEFALADPQLAAACVHAAIVRYCHPVLVSQCPEAPVPPLEGMIAFLLRALGAPEGARGRAGASAS